jgi:hypothetical protein
MNMVKKTSILLKNYKNSIWDLIDFLETSETKKLKIFQKITLKIYKKIKNNLLNDPINLNIYKITIEEILKNTKEKNKKDIDFINSKIEISNFDTDAFQEIETIKPFLNNIRIKEILLLCLLNRHSLNIKECSYVLNENVSLLLLSYTKSKEIISKNLILKTKKTKKNNIVEQSKDCFFIKNKEALFQNKMLNKKQEENIKEHLKNCNNCKNIYKWHDFINNKIEKEIKNPIIKNISNLVFKYINKRNYNLNFIYFIKKSFLVKIMTVVILISTAVFIIKAL